MMELSILSPKIRIGEGVRSLEFMTRCWEERGSKDYDLTGVCRRDKGGSAVF